MSDINVQIQHIKLDPQQTNSSGLSAQSAQNLIQQHSHLRSGQADIIHSQFYNQQLMNPQFNNNTNNNNNINTNILSTTSSQSSSQQSYPNSKQTRQQSNNNSHSSKDEAHQIPSSNIPNLFYQQQFSHSQQQQQFQQSFPNGNPNAFAQLFIAPPPSLQIPNQIYNDQMNVQNNGNAFQYSNQLSQNNSISPIPIGGMKSGQSSSQSQKQNSNSNRKVEYNSQFQLPLLGKSQSEQVQGQVKQGFSNNNWSTQNINNQSRQSFLDNYFSAGDFLDMKPDFGISNNLFTNQQQQQQQQQHHQNQLPLAQSGISNQDENGYQGNTIAMTNNSSNLNNLKKNNYSNNNTNIQQQQLNQPSSAQSSQIDQRKLKIVDFKVHACTKRDKHEKKKCPYYHNDGDRRRCPEKHKYSFNECKKKDKCPLKDDCPQVHNKVEQLYHPLRYKAKFCESYKENNQKCEYGNFCSFAHHESEIVIPMICKLQKDAIFYMYFYKTVWCPNTQKHERAYCPYMHNVQDFRRDPKMFQLEPRQCEQWKKTNISKYSEGECPLQLKCTNCHGWKEHDYHPQVYKTKPCNIENCPQNLECVLYHSEEDRRIITPQLLKIEEDQARDRLKSLINTSNQDVKLGAPIDVFYTETEEIMNNQSSSSMNSSYNNNNNNMNNNSNNNNNNNNQNNSNNNNNNNQNNNPKNRGKSNTMNNQSHSYPHNRQSSNSQSGPSQGQYNNHQKNQGSGNQNQRSQENRYQNVNGNYNNNRQGKNNYNNSNYQPVHNNNNNNNNNNYGNNNYNSYQNQSYQQVNSNPNIGNMSSGNSSTNSNNNSSINNIVNNRDIQNSNFNNNNNSNNNNNNSNNNSNNLNNNFSKTISNNNNNQPNFNNYQAISLSQSLSYNNFVSMAPSNNSEYNEVKSVYSSNTEQTASNYGQSRGSSVGKDDFDQQTIINQGITNHPNLTAGDISFKQFMSPNINPIFSNSSNHFNQDSSLSRKNSYSELQKYFEKKSQSELYELLLQNQYSDEDILRLANYQLPFLNDNQKNTLKNIILKFNDEQEYKDIQNLGKFQFLP